MSNFQFVPILLFVTLMTMAAGDSQPLMAGSLGSPLPPDDTVNNLVQKLKPDIIQKICALPSNSKCPSPDATIQVVQYKTQTVAGTNYFVSLLVDNVPYQARIFQQTWTNTEDVTDVKATQKGSEITYF